MKLNDFIFRFTSNIRPNQMGICRVRTFCNNTSDLFVMLSELDENPSTSVTNALECIIQQLTEQQKIPAQAKILEHYPKTIGFSESFDLIDFDEAGGPVWRPVSRSFVLKTLDIPPTEFAEYKEDPRIQEEIQDALNGAPKIEQFKYVEPIEITERRLEIFANQHRMQSIRDFLDTNPSETAMTEFLEQDMSLFAESLAYPSEEYICFSQFPVGTGRVDFALFTGRSRMDVYLIEIKGANCNLCRQDHYREFRAAVQEGRGQLIARASWCTQNYDSFRAFVHQVLQEVKNGRRPYRAFTGPRHELQVDPNKDVKLHYLLIAGRTSDNLPDSKKRHTEDSFSSIDIQTETWDSWADKLTRQ